VTAIVEKNTNKTAVSIWAGETWEPDGTEEFDAIPGDIKLVSAVSRMDGASKHVGQFWHSDRAGERAFSETLDVIPLMVRTNRAFFAADGNEPLCRSNDGKTIDPGQALWQRESVKVKDGLPPIDVGPEPSGCATCPFSRWEGNNEPPLCGEAKVLFMIRKDDETPARYRVSGAGIKPLTKWIRQEVVSARRPLYSWRLTISALESSRGGKKWFEPVFHGTDLELDEAKFYQTIVAQQRARFEMTEDGDAEFDHAPQGQATPSKMSSIPADLERAFWQDIDAIPFPREEVASIIAPRTLSDLGEEQMWGLIPVITAAVATAKLPAKPTLGELRVVVEAAKAALTQMPL